MELRAQPSWSQVNAQEPTVHKSLTTTGVYAVFVVSGQQLKHQCPPIVKLRIEGAVLTYAMNTCCVDAHLVHTPRQANSYMDKRFVPCGALGSRSRLTSIRTLVGHNGNWCHLHRGFSCKCCKGGLQSGLCGVSSRGLMKGSPGQNTKP